MKHAILIMLGIELLLLLGGLLKLVVRGVKSDLAGQGMTIAYTIIATIIAAMLMAASYGLATHDKWLWFALTLTVIAAVFVLVVLVME
ncbi:MAG: hypothetical protein M3O62_08210 [Pseudomonadota bacterium]|nr:hypothetical protein [Pseudomonadota bacterium]